MKWFVASVLGVAIAGLNLSAPAAEGEAKPERKRGEGAAAELIKRFDKNGDGQLSEDEKAEAKKAMEARKAGGAPEGRKAFDLNNPPEFVVKKFDKDGDGKLNDAEKAAAQKAIAARKGEQPGAARPDGARFAELIKKFDKDGDGKLSEEEKAAARASGEGPRKPRGEKPAPKRAEKKPE